MSYYGDNCSTPCHQNCLDGRCDIVDGTCLGCVPGYTGSMCDKVVHDIKKKDDFYEQNTHLRNI